MVQKWNPIVTHVIASTDENGACKRTFKVLMGILEGKWILSVECQYRTVQVNYGIQILVYRSVVCLCY